MEDLMERLVGEDTNEVLEEYYQVVVGRMLARRLIVICEGLVTVGDGTDQQA